MNKSVGCLLHFLFGPNTFFSTVLILLMKTLAFFAAFSTFKQCQYYKCEETIWSSFLRYSKPKRQSIIALCWYTSAVVKLVQVLDRIVLLRTSVPLVPLLPLLIKSKLRLYKLSYMEKLFQFKVKLHYPKSSERILLWILGQM